MRITRLRSSVQLLGLQGLLTLALATASPAQQLTPRAYWPAPTGSKVVLFGYSYGSGDVLTDPTLPVEGVTSRSNVLLGGFIYNFGLGGRSANVLVQVPYSWGTTQGLVVGQQRRRDVSGFADVHARLAINLKGAPAMDVNAFRAFLADPKSVLGWSLEIQVPTGEYDATKLVNLGSNRWSAKTELGLAAPFRRGWIAEIAVGAWLFGDNDEFVGSTLEQRPILEGEAHLVHEIRPRFWVSLDLNYYHGGRTITDGVESRSVLGNSRLGATAVFPFGRIHAIKLGYSTGIITEKGGNFDQVLLSYLYAWR